MKLNKKIGKWTVVLIMSMVILSSLGSAAVTVSISADKGSYYPGEVVQFNATVNITDEMTCQTDPDTTFLSIRDGGISKNCSIPGADTPNMAWSCNCSPNWGGSCVNPPGNTEEFNISLTQTNPSGCAYGADNNTYTYYINWTIPCDWGAGTYTAEMETNFSGTKRSGTTTFDVLAYSISIPLNVGWNLVSIPAHPGDTSVAEALASLGDPANVGPGTWDGNYTKVQAYIDGGWESFIPTVPGGGALTNINETMGFWINMTQDDTLVVEGCPPQRNIPLKVGWNMMGYASTKQTQPVADALSSLGDPANVGPGTWDGNYTKVQAYIDGGWESFIPTVPGGGALTNMTWGYGYWINMTQYDMLEYD